MVVAKPKRGSGLRKNGWLVPAARIQANDLAPAAPGGGPARADLSQPGDDLPGESDAFAVRVGHVGQF